MGLCQEDYTRAAPKIEGESLPLPPGSPGEVTLAQSPQAVFIRVKRLDHDFAWNSPANHLFIQAQTAVNNRGTWRRYRGQLQSKKMRPYQPCSHSPPSGQALEHLYNSSLSFARAPCNAAFPER